MHKIHSYQWNAMGSKIIILFPFIAPSHLIFELKSIFSETEKKYSRFKKDSLLSKLNTEKKLKANEEFLEIFRLSQKVYHETQGAFNPLLSVKTLGYEDSYRDPKQIKNKNYNTSFESINIKNGNIHLHDSQELDFGGIVKGWTVDKACKYLLKNKVKNFLINAGGDIFASGKANKNEKWRIEIEKTGQIIELENQAIASSGKTKRFWNGSDGNFYHHILNTSTKNSAKNDLGSMSILASSCSEADAWATAAYSLGRTDGQNLLIRNGKKYYLNFLKGLNL